MWTLITSDKCISYATRLILYQNSNKIQIQKHDFVNKVGCVFPMVIWSDFILFIIIYHLWFSVCFHVRLYSTRNMAENERSKSSWFWDIYTKLRFQPYSLIHRRSDASILSEDSLKITESKVLRGLNLIKVLIVSQHWMTHLEVMKRKLLRPARREEKF